MANKNSDKWANRLETLREAGRLACERVLEKRSDIVAIYVRGSVARGNIHEKSDADIVAVIGQGDDKEGESLEELGCSVEIVYYPLRVWEEELYYNCGSDWEVDASSVMDSLVLYDPNGLIKKAKQELGEYPEEKRKKRIREIHGNMSIFSGAAWHHFINKDYDIESIFSKLYAYEALRMLFPINKVYLWGNKYLFKQVEELQEEPPNYLQKCLSLLWFKSKNVNYDEATWIVNNISETMKVIEAKMRSLGSDFIPPWLQ